MVEVILWMASEGKAKERKQRANLWQLAAELGTSLEKFKPLYNEYKALGRRSSETFHFWDEYLKMVWLLLDFVHADRDSNWNLHLETFNDMLPYDRAFDHQNYFRWGTVYISDMRMLPTTAPSVHREFTENRAHAISKSSESLFSAVSPDMALEQTQNKGRNSRNFWHAVISRQMGTYTSYYGCINNCFQGHEWDKFWWYLP